MPRAASRLSIDGLFEAFYRRAGARYVDAFKIGVWAFICLLVTPGYVALLTAPWHPTSDQYVRCLLAYELALGVICGPGTLVIARWVAPATFRWVGGDHAPATAPAAWASTVAGLPRWMAITCSWWLLWCVPPSIYTAATLHFAWYGYPIFVATLAGMVAVVGVFGYLLFEQALRPVAREIAAVLPRGCDPPRSVMTLGIKALVLIPGINFFSAVVVASLVSSRSRPPLHLGQIALLAVVVSGTLSLGLTLLFRNSIVRRIEDLRGAMRSVDGGDLETYVVPLAGDELDDMAASFNEMVAGLRERASLREHNADLVVDLQRQADELRDSRARIVAASDAARRQVERDLHDGAQQRLVLLGLKLRMARDELERDPVLASRAIEELGEDLAAALAELRALAHGIYPTLLENDGLPAALEEAARHGAITTEIDSDMDGRHSPAVESAVYFCCLEALQNAGKYAGAGARARVRLTNRGGALEFAVTDDGRGFDASAPGRASSGLQNMIDRIGALGGLLLIDSSPGHGTTVTGTLPRTRGD